MKKKLLTIAVTAAMVFSLVACGTNNLKRYFHSQHLRYLVKDLK